MSAGKFFTFPLCLLAMPKPFKEKLQIIVGHSMQRAGESDTEIHKETLKAAGKAVRGWLYYDDQHVAIVRGSIICSVTLGDIKATVSRCNEAIAFTAEHEAKHGKCPLVFISAALVWSAHNNDDPSERLFTTQCAVNSVIGFKQFPVLIRREMIRARQLGYKSPAVMRAELREDQSPLTTKQLRGALDELEERELLFRCQASRTRTYFSTMTTWDELRAGVAKIKDHWSKVQAERLKDREQLGANQGPTRGHLKRKQPPEPGKGPLKNEGPSEGQPGATGRATEGATNGATKTNAFKQMPLNKRSNERSPAGVGDPEKTKQEDGPEHD